MACSKRLNHENEQAKQLDAAYNRVPIELRTERHYFEAFDALYQRKRPRAVISHDWRNFTLALVLTC